MSYPYCYRSLTFCSSFLESWWFSHKSCIVVFISFLLFEFLCWLSHATFENPSIFFFFLRLLRLLGCSTSLNWALLALSLSSSCFRFTSLGRCSSSWDLVFLSCLCVNYQLYHKSKQTSGFIIFIIYCFIIIVKPLDV